MLIEKYCEDESWRAGYREACFDLCVGNLDKDKAFELARDADEEDIEEENASYQQGYEDGYSDGVGKYEDWYEDEEELPEEIVLDATVYNNIEELKTKVRTTINALHKTNTKDETIKQLWDVVSGLVDLEKEIAGNEVLDYYINR